MRTPKKYVENRSSGNEVHELKPETVALMKRSFSLYRNGYRDREIGEVIGRTRATVRKYFKIGGGLTTFDKLCHIRNRENKEWLI